ncbi:hypothetical protein V8C86DRAFT_2838227 [Haematococcus lacustris]
MYTDEWAAFRAAVCKAAGLPDSKVEHALLQLQTCQPHLLQGLVKHCSLPATVMQEELSHIQPGMALMGSEVAQLQCSRDKAAAKGPVALPRYLQAWWSETVGLLEMRVASSDFLAHLVNWSKETRLSGRLAAYDRRLREECKLPLLPHQEHAFLNYILIPLIDMDKDGFVTQSELHRLHRIGEEFAEQALELPPDTLPELLMVIFLVPTPAAVGACPGNWAAETRARLQCVEARVHEAGGQGQPGRLIAAAAVAAWQG